MSESKSPAEHGSSRGGKYLTFSLADEEYGLEILKVHEIIGVLPITRVPRTPEHIRGVINLRGKVIPVVDLRRKFSLPPVDTTDLSCIIVVRVGGVETGIIVDSVSEVRDIPEAEIDDAPAFGSDVDTSYLLGVGKSEGRVKLLLDIDRVLSREDLTHLQRVRGDGTTDA